MTANTYLVNRLVGSITPWRRAPLAREMCNKASCCLLDYFAAACAGTTSRTAGVGAGVIRVFGEGSCTAIGLCRTTSPAGAALYNGLIGHAEELDDSHRYVSGLHLGTAIIPAVLALAEEQDASIDKVLQAIVCGYEIAGRLCRCIDKMHRARGFHSTGTIAPFGAAAGCSVLLQMNEQQIANALGIAASSSAGLFAFLENGATVKHFHAGRPALDGLMAALLAQGGMTGPDSVFEAKEGFFRAYAESFDADFLDADLGEPELTKVYFKMYSACGHTFPAIDTALILRNDLKKRNLSVCDIQEIRYESYHASTILNNQYPQTIQEARFSVPFILSLALLKGRVTRSDLISTLNDVTMLELSKKVHLMEAPDLNEAFPKRRACRLVATMKSGEVLSFSIDSPRGTPDNPVSRDELEDKFREEAKAILSLSAIQTVVDMLRGEYNQSVRTLLALFRSK